MNLARKGPSSNTVHSKQLYSVIKVEVSSNRSASTCNLSNRNFSKNFNDSLIGCRTRSGVSWYWLTFLYVRRPVEYRLWVKN